MQALMVRLLLKRLEISFMLLVMLSSLVEEKKQAQ